MRLPFGEVKRDIRAGYNYREYEVVWKGNPMTVVWDGHNDEVIYDFTQWDETDPCRDFRYFRLPVRDFLSTSYKEILERVGYLLFV